MVQQLQQLLVSLLHQLIRFTKAYLPLALSDKNRTILAHSTNLQSISQSVESVACTLDREREREQMLQQWAFRQVRACVSAAQAAMLWLLTVTGLRLPLWNLFVHILEHYRSVLVLVVVMPMSFVFDLFWRARTWSLSNYLSSHLQYCSPSSLSAYLYCLLLFGDRFSLLLLAHRYIAKVKTAPQQHHQRVKAIQAQVTHND